jgi:hypothetical protein
MFCAKFPFIKVKIFVVPDKSLSDCWNIDFMVIFYALCGTEVIPMPNIFEIGQPFWYAVFPFLLFGILQKHGTARPNTHPAQRMPSSILMPKSQ